MSVTVTLRGRLGNNLFQYAIGRIIAEQHGFALRCRQMPLQPEQVGRLLPVEGPCTLAALAAQFPNAPLTCAGASYDAPLEAYEVKIGGSWSGQTIDLREILGDPRPRQILLHGFFQRFEYLADRWSDIRVWFAAPAADDRNGANPDDVVLNIRRGADYAVMGWILPLEYYDHALEAVLDTGQVHICGTGIDARVRQHFRRYDPVYLSASPIQTFRQMSRFNRIVLSNSTFAWWAGALSSAGAIVAPRAVGSGYAFRGFGDVDLHMRRPSYCEIPVARFEP